jgi:hypothetical protein
MYRIKGENLIENHTPFPMVQETHIHAETSSLENSQDYA